MSFPAYTPVIQHSARAAQTDTLWAKHWAVQATQESRAYVPMHQMMSERYTGQKTSHIKGTPERARAAARNAKAKAHPLDAVEQGKGTQEGNRKKKKKTPKKGERTRPVFAAISFDSAGDGDGDGDGDGEGTHSNSSDDEAELPNIVSSSSNSHSQSSMVKRAHRRTTDATSTASITAKSAVAAPTSTSQKKRSIAAVLGQSGGSGKGKAPAAAAVNKKQQRQKRQKRSTATAAVATRPSNQRKQTRVAAPTSESPALSPLSKRQRAVSR